MSVMMRNRIAILVLAALLLPIAAAADDAPCGKLNDWQREMSQHFFKTHYLYACCDRTIRECLQKEPVCDAAVRVQDQSCRLILDGGDDLALARALDTRAQTMLPALEPYKYDPSNAYVFGDSEARVTALIYFCVPSLESAQLIPWLYREIMTGALKGKVKLVLKLFPSSNTDSCWESALAAMAAGEQGKFFEYIDTAFYNLDEFSIPQLSLWAQDIELDVAKFKTDMKSKAIADRLAASKAEALASKIDVTPTLIINGRLYRAAYDRETIQDILLEEYQRLIGLKWNK